MRNRLSAQHQARSLITKRIRTERSAIRSLIFLTIGYVVSWLPYALLALATFFGLINNSQVSPYLSLFFGLFAKLSFIWIPTFYIITNKNLRLKETPFDNRLFGSILTSIRQSEQINKIVGNQAEADVQVNMERSQSATKTSKLPQRVTMIFNR